MMADFIRNGRIGEHYENAGITQPVRKRSPTQAPLAESPDL
jgi:hypothetical protein